MTTASYSGRRRYTSPDVACPYCGAGQGEPCRGSVRAGRGHRRVGYHNARRDAARDLNQTYHDVNDGGA